MPIDLSEGYIHLSNNFALIILACMAYAGLSTFVTNYRREEAKRLQAIADAAEKAQEKAKALAAKRAKFVKSPPRSKVHFE